jgi:hypothetical protein
MVGVLVVLNVYELLVVSLACYLIRARGTARDGKMLLLIEVLLLVDSTNLLAESWTIYGDFGLRANAAALILAGIKIGTVAWLLGLRYRLREMIAAALGYLGMLAMPGIMAAWNSRGADMERPLHFAWWGAGALVVVLAVLVPRGKREMSPLERALGRAALFAPWLSLLAHLFLSHYVHRAALRPCNLAPVILGVAAAVLHRRPALLDDGIGYVLGATAGLCLLLAMWSSPWLSFDLPGLEGLVYSPLRAVLLGLAVLFLWATFTGRGKLHALPASLFLTSAASGHSAGTIFGTWRTMASGLVPRTQSQWGIVSVIAAFLLLGAGAVASVFRKAAAAGQSPAGEAGGTGGSGK